MAKEKLLRVFAFESTTALQETLERVGDNLALGREGKTCWARVDEDTSIVWVRFDILAADRKIDRNSLHSYSTRVLLWSRWVTFDDFKLNFPRAQMPYKRGKGDDGDLYNTDCMLPNSWQDTDDHEAFFFTDDAKNNKADQWVLDRNLDWSQQAHVIDKARTKACWKEAFGTASTPKTGDRPTNPIDFTASTGRPTNPIDLVTPSTPTPSTSELVPEFDDEPTVSVTRFLEVTVKLRSVTRYRSDGRDDEDGSA